MPPRHAVGALIGANLAIALLVVLRGWGYYEVILVYWLEALVVGVFTVARMAVVATLGAPLGTWIDASAPLTRIFLLVFGVGFFVVKYGAFAIGMGLLVVMVPAFLGTAEGTGVLRALSSVGATALLAAGVLVVSHGISFAVNFVAGREYERTNLLYLMIHPYVRMWLVMVTLAAGLVAAHFLPALGVSAAFGVTVVLLKTGADLIAHRVEHAATA